MNVRKKSETDTLVTIELLSKDGGTEIVLTHTLFQTEAQRDQHAKGWTGCFARLVPLLG